MMDMKKNKIVICLTILSSLIQNASQTLPCEDEIIAEFATNSVIFAINCADLNRKFPVIMLDENLENFTNFHWRKPDFYLINIKQDNLGIFAKLSTLDSFNPTARFIIITSNVTRELLKMLSRFYIHRTTIVAESNRTFTYLPYKNQNVQQPNLQPIHLPEKCEFVFEDNSPKLWKNTRLQAFAQCVPPYVICDGHSNEFEGIEIGILELLQQILQFQTVFVVQPNEIDGKRINNTHGEYYLNKRQVDMILGSYRTIGAAAILQNFDFTNNHLHDGLVWVVPRSSTPYWKRTIRVFSSEVWLALFVTLLLVAIIVGKLHRIRGFSSAFLLVFQQFFAQNYRSNKLKSNTGRILSVFWCFFSMLMIICFSSKLIAAFFGNYPTYQINTFNGIVGSNLKIGVTNDVQMMLRQDYQSQTINKTLEICPFGTVCLNKTLYDRNFVSCYGKRNIKYRTARMHITENGEPIIYFIDDRLLHFHVVFYFNKGYPLITQINRKINQFKAAGFIEHIERTIEHTNRLSSGRIRKLETRVLTLKHLKAPFYLIIVGWIISVFIFFTEYLLCTSRK